MIEFRFLMGEAMAGNRPWLCSLWVQTTHPQQVLEITSWNFRLKTFLEHNPRANSCKRRGSTWVLWALRAPMHCTCGDAYDSTSRTIRWITKALRFWTSLALFCCIPRPASRIAKLPESCTICDCHCTPSIRVHSKYFSIVFCSRCFVLQRPSRLWKQQSTKSYIGTLHMKKAGRHNWFNSGPAFSHDVHHMVHALV